MSVKHVIQIQAKFLDNKLLCDFFEVTLGNLNHGGTEDVDGDDKVGAATLVEDLPLLASKGTSDDTDVVTEAEGLGGEGDGTIGVVEHEAEHVHLAVRDDSEGMATEVVGMSCFIGQKILDVGEFDHLTSFGFGDSNEDEVGDQHSLDLLLLSCAPDTHLVLGGYVGFIAKVLQPLTAGFLSVATHQGNEPLAIGHAFGVVNFRSWRHRRNRLRVDLHNSIHKGRKPFSHAIFHAKNAFGVQRYEEIRK